MLKCYGRIKRCVIQNYSILIKTVLAVCSYLTKIIICSDSEETKAEGVDPSDSSTVPATEGAKLEKP